MKDDYPTYYPRTPRSTQSLWIWAGLLFAAFVAGLFLGSAADAETTTGPLEPAAGTWRSHRGPQWSIAVCSANSEAGVMACSAADAERRRESTRYRFSYPNRYILITYVVSTPVDCVVSAWTDWAAGDWSTCAGGTQTRQETRTRTVVTQPAHGGAACPALSEVRTGTQPCTVPDPTAWTHCANQGELCPFTGTRHLRYGADTRWVERDVVAENGGWVCDNRLGNPAVGVTKTCQLQGAVMPPTDPPPDTGTGTARVHSWNSPTTNTDGTAAQVTGFRIVYGRAPAELVSSVEVLDPASRSYIVTQLGAGTWYFAIMAVASGNASGISNVVQKTVL